MNGWYYARSKQQFGPVTQDEMRRLIRSGELMPADLVWTEGMDGWKQAQTVQGLFESVPGPIPPTAALISSPAQGAGLGDWAVMLVTVVIIAGGGFLAGLAFCLALRIMIWVLGGDENSVVIPSFFRFGVGGALLGGGGAVFFALKERFGSGSSGKS